jgi:hypothetical protein
MAKLHDMFTQARRAQLLRSWLNYPILTPEGPNQPLNQALMGFFSPGMAMTLLRLSHSRML